MAMKEYPPKPKPRSRLPEPNPFTQRIHRQEILRQVIIPLILGIILVVVIVYGLGRANMGDLDRWVEVSIIFLLLPLFILGWVPLAAIIFLIYAISQILRLLPPYTRLTQQAIRRIEGQIKSGANFSVRPLIQIESFLAIVDQIFGRRK